MTDWMTRRELAAHLKVSLRQTYRLLLPSTGKGRMRRWSREAVDHYLHTVAWVPAGSTRDERALIGARVLTYTPVGIEEQINQMKAKLRPRRRPSRDRDT